jgi:hypothetical protein
VAQRDIVCLFSRKVRFIDLLSVLTSPRSGQRNAGHLCYCAVEKGIQRYLLDAQLHTGVLSNTVSANNPTAMRCGAVWIRASPLHGLRWSRSSIGQNLVHHRRRTFCVFRQLLSLVEIGLSQGSQHPLLSKLYPKVRLLGPFLFVLSFWFTIFRCSRRIATSQRRFCY